MPHRVWIPESLVYHDTKSVSVVNRYGYPYLRNIGVYDFTSEVKEWLAENTRGRVHCRRWGGTLRFHAVFGRANEAVLFRLRFADEIAGN